MATAFLGHGDGDGGEIDSSAAGLGLHGELSRDGVATSGRPAATGSSTSTAGPRTSASAAATAA